MNCADFNERRHEYLDGALDAETRLACREHLRQCADCRSALVRERAFGRGLRESMVRATADLSLAPDLRRRILAGQRKGREPVTGWARIRRGLTIPRVRAFALVSAAAAVLLVVLGIQFIRRSGSRVTPNKLAEAGRTTWIIDVPMRASTHVFRREGNAVLDALAPGEVVGRAQIVETTERSPKPL